MGTVVPGFWDDEPFISSAEPWPFKRLPWSASLDAIGRRGVDSRCRLHRGVRRARPQRVRSTAGTYWRAVNDAFATNYFQRQADVDGATAGSS